MHSRKETAKTAKYLRDKAMEAEIMSKLMKADSGSRELLQVRVACAFCVSLAHCRCRHTGSRELLQAHGRRTAAVCLARTVPLWPPLVRLHAAQRGPAQHGRACMRPL